jgi:hypothetical protein
MDTRSTLNNKIEKNTYQNSDVRVDAYNVTGEDIYYGQIQEIWEFDFHGFKIPLFHCNWVDAIKGVVKDKYGFISVDLNHQGYKSEPFVLAKQVAQVFYVLNTTNKRLKVVIIGKWRIVGVMNSRWWRVWSFWWDSSFCHLDDQANRTIGQRSFVLVQRLPSKVKIFKKPRPQWKVAKRLCKICSMCKNMVICVKIWLSLDICVKYA